MPMRSQDAGCEMTWWQPDISLVAALQTKKGRVVGGFNGGFGAGKTREEVLKEAERERNRLKQQKWRAGKGKAWIQANKERRRQYLRDWHLANYEKHRAYLNAKQREYRQRKKELKCAR